MHYFAYRSKEAMETRILHFKCFVLECACVSVWMNRRSTCEQDFRWSCEYVVICVLTSGDHAHKSNPKNIYYLLHTRISNKAKALQLTGTKIKYTKRPEISWGCSLVTPSKWITLHFTSAKTQVLQCKISNNIPSFIFFGRQHTCVHIEHNLSFWTMCDDLKTANKLLTIYIQCQKMGCFQNNSKRVSSHLVIPKEHHTQQQFGLHA